VARTHEENSVLTRRPIFSQRFNCSPVLAANRDSARRPGADVERSGFWGAKACVGARIGSPWAPDFGAVDFAGRGRWRRRWREVEALEMRRGAAGAGPSASPLALRLGRRHARRQNPSSSRQPWPTEAAVIRHRSRPGRPSRPSTRRLSMR
jgi:hypothetical protein